MDILEYIKSEHVVENESVTVLCKDFCSGLRTEWCGKNGWKCLPYSCMIGCEDQCIVAIDCVPTYELISRARNFMVFVSFQDL